MRIEGWSNKVLTTAVAVRGDLLLSLFATPHSFGNIVRQSQCPLRGDLLSNI
jgi:hypothetical protein